MVLICSLLSFMDILERAETGPVCTPREWNTRVIPETAARKAKEYDIRFDPENPIVSDDSSADDAFQAGFEMAIETGLLCLDTQRRILVDEKEMRAVIREARSELRYGSGADEIMYYARKPEDKRSLRRHTGPFATAVSEDIFISLHQAYCQSHYTDMLAGGTVPTIYGRPIKAGTPSEMLGGMYGKRLLREAARRAGRPGIPLGGGNGTSLDHFGAWSPGGLTVADHCVTSIPSDLKTKYWILSKVAQAWEHGWKIYAFSHPTIGGYAGGPEGATIVSVAAALMCAAVLRGDAPETNPYDGRFFGNSNKEATWGRSLCTEAIARNTHFIFGVDVDPVAGPCTETLLWEVAGCVITNTVSGAAWSNGVRSATGRYQDHVTPLEGVFRGEVEVAARGMKRTNANALYKAINSKFEDIIRSRKAPKGKPVQECYDLKKFKASSEWQEIYERVKKELIDLGLQLES